MQSKKVKKSIKKKDAEPISFSNPNSVKDIPNNPDVKVNPKKMLFGDFIKKGTPNL